MAPLLRTRDGPGFAPETPQSGGARQRADPGVARPPTPSHRLHATGPGRAGSAALALLSTLGCFILNNPVMFRGWGAGGAGGPCVSGTRDQKYSWEEFVEEQIQRERTSGNRAFAPPNPSHPKAGIGRTRSRPPCRPDGHLGRPSSLCNTLGLGRFRARLKLMVVG